VLTRKVSGRLLRELREDQEITGVDLAQRVGVDSSAIYKIEAGERQPSAKLFGRICRALGIEKDALLLSDDEKEAC
jgi:transcriptional regulator with XRE-family HTH domain